MNTLILRNVEKMNQGYGAIQKTTVMIAAFITGVIAVISTWLRRVWLIEIN